MNSLPSDEPNRLDERITALESQVRQILLFQIAQTSALAASLPDLVASAAERLQKLGTLAGMGLRLDVDKRFVHRWTACIATAFDAANRPAVDWREQRALDVTQALLCEFIADSISAAPSRAAA